VSPFTIVGATLGRIVKADVNRPTFSPQIRLAIRKIIQNKTAVAANQRPRRPIKGPNACMCETLEESLPLKLIIQQQIWTIPSALEQSEYVVKIVRRNEIRA
jgi:hypothetical protein